MAKKTVDPKDSNEDLLQALESIKGLLAESETKLSAARDSIKLANEASTSKREEIVPVLEEIVIPGQDMNNDNDEIPILDETIAAELDTAPEAAVDIPQLLDTLDAIQEGMEKQIRESLMQSVVRIESDLKKHLDAKFRELRLQLTDAKPD